MQDIEELGSLVVQVGGRSVEGGWDRLARYCGLRWSGGGDETWAFRYYDAVPSPRPDIVRPLDVLAAGALHPSLTKPHLTYFHEEANEITAWLDALPEDQHLAGCDSDVLRHLADLATWEVPVSLQLLTKVLHRKRPKLIPLVDRHVLDWYRPVTGERSASNAWPALLRAIREDLDLPNVIFLHAMAAAVEEATFQRLSTLRVKCGWALRSTADRGEGGRPGRWVAIWHDNTLVDLDVALAAAGQEGWHMTDAVSCKYHDEIYAPHGRDEGLQGQQVLYFQRVR